MSEREEKPRGGPGISARIVAARVLARVEQDGAFAAAALDAELQRAVQLEARDRALATEIVYGALRVLPWLEARIAKHARDAKGIRGLEPRARAHMLVAAYELAFLTRVPAFAAVSACVDGVRAVSGAKVAAFANAVMRKVAAEGPVDEAGHIAAVADAAAPWLREALARALGADQVGPFLACGVGAPPLGIRVDAGTREDWLARFAEATPRARFELGKASSRAILAWGAGKAQRLPGFDDGAWLVQEEGSQLVAASVGAREGDTVLDACAGRGNKTSLLARAVGTTGAVDAADLHEPKLEALTRELGRLHLAPRATFAVDWSVGAGDVTGTYDRVLVDAPCSGIGTVRRRPDVLARRASEDLARLSTLQRAVLARAADRVRPGGRLVYAVCSVLREEAEDVVASLLAARPDFAPAPFDSPDARALAGDAPTLRLLPHVHGTDGYFLASLIRRENPPG